MNFTIRDAQVFWIFGAIERLATLGLMEAPPYQVSQIGVDNYVRIDEERNQLFVNDNEMKSLLQVILKVETGVDDKNLLDGIFNLLQDYKNNRERLVKYALSQSTS